MTVVKSLRSAVQGDPRSIRRLNSQELEDSPIEDRVVDKIVRDTALESAA